MSTDSKRKADDSSEVGADEEEIVLKRSKTGGETETTVLGATATEVSPPIFREHEDGSWDCPKCGNKNFQSRIVCNMRRCSAPKPGVSPELIAAQEEPQGSWKCGACSNMNYPMRTHCNRRNCGLPKQAPGVPSYGQQQQQQQQQQQWDMFQMQQYQLAQAHLAAGGDPRAAPATSYPNQQATSYYNQQATAYPNQQAYSYPNQHAYPGQQATAYTAAAAVAAASIASTYAAYSAGGCGGGSCGGASAYDGAGAGAAHFPPNAPSGAWICRECSNVNWPMRTACNRRGCAKPRAHDATIKP
mmetsp:Transcript_73580/g.143958  ORF Transcript_73580/g.143958 Transcript_73580/m.143958 type:complete len:301 (+) Transcript_73580:65-967(+)